MAPPGVRKIRPRNSGDGSKYVCEGAGLEKRGDRWGVRGVLRETRKYVTYVSSRGRGRARGEDTGERECGSISAFLLFYFSSAMRQMQTLERRPREQILHRHRRGVHADSRPGSRQSACVQFSPIRSGWIRGTVGTGIDTAFSEYLLVYAVVHESRLGLPRMRGGRF